MLGFIRVAVACMFLAAATNGCSLQLEGERCSVANGNGDCEGSLVCTKHELLSQSPVDRCCPADRQQATTIACSVTFTGASDAGSSPTEPMVDAGSPDAAPADAAILLSDR